MLVLEAAPTIGGGTRTEELTLPGFRHDVCSAIHPLVVGSPFMRRLPLREHGLELVHPEIPLAHPLDDGQRGRAASVGRGDGGRPRRRCDGLPQAHGAARRRVGGRWSATCSARRSDPRATRFAAARFGLPALRSATGLADSRFSGERARALLAGNAAHSMRPLDGRATAAFGLMLLLLGHGVGWPAAVGGSQAIADAMASLLRSLGGEIETGSEVRSLDELRGARSVLFDLTPRQILAITGDALPARYRRALARLPLRTRRLQARLRARRAGALDGAGVPRRRHRARRRPARGDRRGRARGRARRAPAAAVRAGRAAERLRPEPRALPERTRCGPTATCPNGSNVDMTAAIEQQIERFAPGFRELVRARTSMGPAGRAGAQRELHRRRHQRGARRPAPDPVACRPRGRTRTRRRTRACSSARRRRLPAAACTGCAAGTRRAPRSRGVLR